MSFFLMQRVLDEAIARTKALESALEVQIQENVMLKAELQTLVTKSDMLETQLREIRAPPTQPSK